MSSNVVYAPYQSGETVYGVIFAGNSLVYNFFNNALESYDNANWIFYAIVMTEIGTSGNYFMAVPTAALGLEAAKSYLIDVRVAQNPIGFPLNLDPSPATDIRIAYISFDWSGTEILGAGHLDTPDESDEVPDNILAMMRRVFEASPFGNKKTRDRDTGIMILRNAADTDDLSTATQSTVDPIDTLSAGTTP